MINLKKLYEYSFVLISLFPIMGLKPTGIVIGLWSVLSIFIIFKEKTYKKATKNDIRNILILSALYLFYLGNFLLTLDVVLIKKLETCLSFLIFPLFVILNKSYVNKSTLENSLKGFFIANTLLALLTWFKIFQTGFFAMLNENNYYQPVFRNVFSDITGIHLPYLGLLFVFSIFIGIYLIRKTYNNFIKVTLGISCVVFFTSILFFSARMALLSFIVSFVYWAYKTIKNKRVFGGIVIGFIAISLFFAFLTPIKERVKEAIITRLELPSKKMNEDSKAVNFRYAIHHCSFNIIKSNWLFGIGKNNVQKELDDCYSDFTYKNYDDFSRKTYNSHNQYLDLWMAYGIFGLIFLTITFFWGYRLNNELLYNVLLILIFMALLTENIFDRQIGVVFFTFFNILFFINEESINT